jgi:hypothetical protein
VEEPQIVLDVKDFPDPLLESGKLYISILNKFNYRLLYLVSGRSSSTSQYTYADNDIRGKVVKENATAGNEPLPDSISWGIGDKMTCHGLLKSYNVLEKVSSGQ